jgi:TetR/AcrR family transcriptional regulator
MSYIAERRQEEKDRRRGEIIDAAEALYAEIGWDAVTMDQVARRARLSRALLYVYFRDKHDLHLAIVERALEQLRTSFLEAQRGRPDGLHEVEAIGLAYVEYARRWPHYFDACARYQAHEVGENAPDSNEAACRAAGHRVHEVIVASLDRGVADGSIRADLGDPYVTALSLWAFSHGVILITANKGWQIEQQGTTVPGFIDHAFGLALRSLKP